MFITITNIGLITRVRWDATFGNPCNTWPVSDRCAL